jgi:Flp pilus assembly protein protease CpaA
VCPQQAEPFLLAALAAWALALAVDDVRHRRVLNWALAPVAAFALAARAAGGWAGCELTLTSGLAGAAIGLAFWLPGYLLKHSGAGDAKCAMVMGLVLGASRSLEFNLLGFLFLGLMSVVAMLGGRRGQRIPAVPALSLAFVAALASGPWWLGRGM